MRGVPVPRGVEWPELAEWAQLQTDSIWADDPAVDSLVQLSGLAAHTQAKLGVRAELIADRPPLLAAKQLVTLHRLSNGRVIVAYDEFEQFAETALAIREKCEPGAVIPAMAWGEIELRTG